MYEKERRLVNIKVNRGTGWETIEYETEIIHRCPPSDEGWCLFQGNLTWWDGLKGIAITLLFGSPKVFSKTLSEGADFRTLSKFQVPKFENLTEISCEIPVGTCLIHWSVSEPTPLNGLVLRVQVHKEWDHLYLQNPKGKVLGMPKSSPELDSVRTDRQLLISLTEQVLGCK